MNFTFRKLEQVAVDPVGKETGQNLESGYALLKLRAAFNLCWELPQIVADRLFSSKQIAVDDDSDDRERIKGVLSLNFRAFGCSLADESKIQFECAKYLAFPRFRSNVCLKVVTAYVKEARLFVALFATEGRPVDAEATIDKNLPICELPFAYAMSLSPTNTEVSFFLSNYDYDHPAASVASSFGLTPGWFQFGLVRKVTAWMNNPEFEVGPSDQPRSMRLVDPELYLSTYLHLKESIGSYWIKNWPERTDPQKFVYEELAIAAYMLTILRQMKIHDQEQDKSSLTTFADLGCGNGFLTYALNNAKLPDVSVSGFGIDARKRKIWDIYPSMSDKLIEAPVCAENLDQFKDAEWFVGNHSDELTPWIPYIASKCGPNSKVFLLPCCPFDFNQKFNVRIGGKSLYGGYLDYIERLCALCGFEVQRDRLRIPSTKRVCFICTKRSHLSVEEAERNRKELAALVQKNNNRSAAVAPRSEDPMLPKAPEIRNCTAIAFELKQLIVTELFAMLMDESSTEDYAVVQLGDGRSWRAGGRLLLSEAIQRLSARSIEALKDQDGGLKTFCKNHAFALTVVAGGSIYFRPHPAAVAFLASRHRSSKKPSRTQQQPDDEKSRTAGASQQQQQTQPKPCLFELFHPDGCPYWPLASDCRSVHKAPARQQQQTTSASATQTNIDDNNR